MRFLLTIVLSTMIPNVVFADHHCDFGELKGEWTIFHKDASVPSSHIALNSTIDIQFQGSAVNVKLNDVSGNWKLDTGLPTYICNLKKELTVLFAIVNGDCKHHVSIYRVQSVSDLRRKPDMSRPVEQIEFDQYKHEGECELRPLNFDVKNDDEIHPGHIHGDKD